MLIFYDQYPQKVVFQVLVQAEPLPLRAQLFQVEQHCSLQLRVPLVFPVHPRTRKNIERLELMTKLERVPQLIISEPLNYINFMNLVFNCRFALTDSGGIQEETTYLGIPCLTLRPNTERPISVEQGTNRLCNLDNLEDNLQEVLSAGKPAKPEIELWDGRTAERVVESIKRFLTGLT